MSKATDILYNFKELGIFFLISPQKLLIHETPFSKALTHITYVVFNENEQIKGSILIAFIEYKTKSI